jgi:hypothetical protein
MRKHLQGIDHVVIAVNGIAGSGDDYRRLGFTLTPRGRHTTGSENHCIMFERDYFELLSVPVPHPVTRYYQEFLERGEGLAALALATDDASGFHDELAADGIAVDAPVDFSRPVQLALGTFDAAFRITQLQPQAAPAGRVFACQHFTRDLVWRPEYLRHENQALGLAGIAAVVEATQLASLANRYATIFGSTLQAGTLGGALHFDVVTGNTPIRFTTAEGFAALLRGVPAPTRQPPCFAALFFRTANVRATRQVLRANGVPSVDVPQGVAVAPEHGRGVALVFGKSPVR